MIRDRWIGSALKLMCSKLNSSSLSLTMCPSSFLSWMNGTTFLCSPGTQPIFCLLFSLSWSMSFLRSSWFHLLKSSRFSPSLHLRWCFYDLRGDCFLAGLLKWMSDYFPCVSQLKSYSEICVFFNIITTLKYWKITDGLWTLELLYISHWCSGGKNALWERCYCYIHS